MGKRRRLRRQVVEAVPDPTDRKPHPLRRRRAVLPPEPAGRGPLPQRRAGPPRPADGATMPDRNAADGDNVSMREITALMDFLRRDDPDPV